MKLNHQGNALRHALPLLLSATCTTDLEEIPLDYHQVKASFLLNLLRFVEWPEDACPRIGRLRLNVCGAPSLDAFYALDGAHIGKRVISVERIKPKDLSAQLEDCQILVIGSDVLVTSVPIARGLLTVGEADGFNAAGGILNLPLRHGRVCFQLNEEVAQACGFVVNPRLFTLRAR